eukprot:m51a1_g5503 hypothetical protein (208) ;mRNA; f:368446-369069
MSDQFKPYSLLFPQAPRVANLLSAEEYAALRRSPEMAPRFEWGCIDSVFESFVRCSSSDGTAITPGTVYRFTHDKIKYDAIVECVNIKGDKGGEVERTTIRLPNDGFLYRPHSEVHVSREPADVPRHHHGLPWCMLDLTDINQLPCMRDFAKRFLHPDKVVINLYYTPEFSRMDYVAKAKASGRTLAICFEPGYPAEAFNDEWAFPI